MEEMGAYQSGWWMQANIKRLEYKVNGSGSLDKNNADPNSCHDSAVNTHEFWYVCECVCVWMCLCVSVSWTQDAHWSWVGTNHMFNAHWQLERSAIRLYPFVHFSFKILGRLQADLLANNLGLLLAGQMDIHIRTSTRRNVCPWRGDTRLNSAQLFQMCIFYFCVQEEGPCFPFLLHNKQARPCCIVTLALISQWTPNPCQ